MKIYSLIATAMTSLGALGNNAPIYNYKTTGTNTQQATIHNSTVTSGILISYYDNAGLYADEGTILNTVETSFPTYNPQASINDYPYSMMVSGKIDAGSLIAPSYTLSLHTGYTFANTSTNIPILHYDSFYECYTSNDSNWQNYIDLTGYTISTAIYQEIIDNITDINNSYSYQRTYGTKAKSINAVSETNQEIVNDIEFNIDSTQDTYYVIMLKYQLVLASAQGGNPIPVYNKWMNQIFTSYTYIIQDGTTEIIDLPGMMFTILTMPFTFVSQAFNLTIFPGTNYAVNIGNLFLAVFAILLFGFILTKLIKG